MPSQFKALHTVAAAGALLIFCGALALIPNPWPTDDALVEALPPTILHDAYRGAGACRSCHPSQWSSWRATYHRTMTQKASSEAIVAPFDGRNLVHEDETFTVRQDQERFLVCRDDQDKCWRVVMTTGSHHIQAYWIRNEDGALQQFPWVYLIREDLWIPNAESFLHPNPASGLGSFYWSENCVFCHTTGPAWPGRIADVSETAVAELGISCEACHGTADRHIQGNQHPVWRYQQHLDEESTETSIVNPSRLSSARASAVCGRCHASTPHPAEGELDGMETFKPGDLFEDHFNLDTLDALVAKATHDEAIRPLSFEEREALGAFWPDGTIRVAGREYNGMIRSACTTQGDMGCLDCHSMHNGPPDKLMSPAAQSPDLCLTCHASIGQDIASHTHHAPNSVGSDCLACHMPHTSYGLLSATRQHRIDSPTASGLTTRDRPNACNLCHLDQTQAWTANLLNRWYGQPKPTLNTAHRTIAAGPLWLLQGDAAQRAITAWHVGTPQAALATDIQTLVPLLAPLLDDPYAAVRHLASRSLVRIDGYRELDPRTVSRSDAMKQWSKTRPKTGRSELLQHPDGTLNTSELEQLLKARDNRETWISE